MPGGSNQLLMWEKKKRRAIRVRDESLTVEREPAILVGGYRPGELMLGEAPLEELEQLAQTAGARVVGKVVQHIREIHPGTYIGSGKVEEVRDLAKRMKAKCIIFDHDLSPSQGRSLDKATEAKVMDRTDLILDIFASRARSRMSKVQVNLALNEYRLPRLRRLWTHLERQAGGIGMRGGPGERQIETDRRKVLKTIHDLKAELKKIEGRKERMVQQRGQDHFLVSLVGYTNAGKSTLMRALTGEDVLVEDKLFATLDTKTARLSLGRGLDVMLSDTVGFIRRLPHNLVASFHATLEETREADLLLHVVDVSSPHAREQMDAVNGVLRELGCAKTDALLVFNKTDRLNDEQLFDYKVMCAEYPEAISVSARQKLGLDTLRSAVTERLRKKCIAATIRVHAGDGKALSFLATHFIEDHRRMDDEWVVLSGRTTAHALQRLRGLAGENGKAHPIDIDADEPVKTPAF